MKIKEGIISHKIDDEHVMLFVSELPEDFQGILRSNEEGQFIIDCLREDVTKEEILAKMQETYDGDPEEMEQDIDIVIENLRVTGALETD